MLCPHCGHEVDQTDKSCPACGGMLSAPASPAPPKRQAGRRQSEASRRRSPRIELQIPVLVRWVSKTGSVSEEASKTAVVNAHGCTVGLKGILFDGLPVELENSSSKAAQKGRVAYSGASGPDGRAHVVIEFDEPDVYFWGTEYAVTAAAPIPVSATARPQEERRQHPRYKCEGRAGLLVEGMEVETAGTLSDISRGGCYVETMSPLAVETPVHATLEVEDVRIEAEAVVRVSHLAMGMGLHFVELDAENQVRLERLLAGLAPESKTAAAVTTASVRRRPSPAKREDSSAVLEALVRVLGSKGVLTREELMQAIEEVKADSSLFD